jgi:DNA-binding beta-propeller fold protein YncE
MMPINSTRKERLVFLARRRFCTFFVSLALAGWLGLVLPDARADLLVSSRGNDRILRYDETTGAFLGVFASGPELVAPAGMAFGPDKNLYVSSNGTNEVLRYDGSTGHLINHFAAGTGLLRPTGLAFGPDQNLYVNGNLSQAVLRFNGATGTFIDRFSGLQRPDLGLAFGPDQNLYVSSRGTSDIRRYNGSTGAFDIFVRSGSGSLFVPAGIVFGPDGNLYVASNRSGQVLRYNRTTGAPMPAAGQSGAIFTRGDEIGGPTDVAFGPDGNLYVTSHGNSSVLRYDGQTGAFIDEFVPSGSGGLSGPNYLIFTPRGPVVPEPASLTLLGMATLSVLGYAWRCGRQK